MKTAVLATVLCAVLAVTIAMLAIGWRRLDVEVPLIGWVALGAGAVLSLGLGVGLMALSFYSARRGFDDSAAGPPET